MDAEKLKSMLSGQGHDVSLLARERSEIFKDLASAWERSFAFRKKVDELYIDGGNGIFLTPQQMEQVKTLRRAHEAYRVSAAPKADAAVLKLLSPENVGALEREQMPITAVMAVKLKEAQSKIQKDDLSALAILRDNAIDLNQKDRDGLTALAFAAQSGAERCLFALCKFGANPHLTDAMGNTSLHWTCAMGKPRAASILLYHGANPNAVNHIGASVLMLAISRGDLDMAQKLLDYGADLRLKDRKGNTALHRAIMARSKAATQFLVDCGAPLDEANADRLTPLGMSLKFPELAGIFEPLRRQAVAEAMGSGGRRAG